MSRLPFSERLLARLSIPVFTLLFLTACGGAESDSPPATPELRDLLASGTIGSPGGRVEVTDPESPYFGVGIVIPAGALRAPSEIRVFRVAGRLDTLTAVDHFAFEPFDLELRSPARITIGYRPELVEQLLPVYPEEALEIFEETGEPRLLSPFDRQPALDRLSVLTDRLGTFFALPPELFLALHSETRLVDPRLREPYVVRGERTIPIASGDRLAAVGAGSLEDFFLSQAPDNLLVIPGHLESPIDFVGEADWLPESGSDGLFPGRRNVIAVQYSSGRPIAQSANRLYELLLDRATSGFTTDVVAVGQGGLVVRYLLERSHLDQEAFFIGAAPPHADRWIDRVVLVATPNRGVAAAELPLISVFDRSGPDDRERLGGVFDLLGIENGLPFELNRFYEDPEVEYFGIAGEVFDTRGDLFVSVLDALQAPPALQFPTRSRTFQGGFEVEHRNLHEQAARNGVLDQIEVFLGR